MKPFSIMFVCLGNICRSPLAHAVFDSLLEEEGLEGRVNTESSGISPYHQGEQADSRMRETARGHGVKINHRSRPFSRSDFGHYDLIIPMDYSNRRELESLADGDDELEKIRLLGEFHPDSEGRVPLEVPDPYYGGQRGFENVFELVKTASENLLVYVKEQIEA